MLKASFSLEWVLNLDRRMNQKHLESDQLAASAAAVILQSCSSAGLIGSYLKIKRF